MYLILFALLYSVSALSCKTDTLLLPIQNGIVVKDKTDSSLTMHPNGILVSPTDNFNVRSCTDGKIATVTEMPGGSNRYLVIVVATDGRTYGYGLIDTATVIRDQAITKGAIIGTLTKGQREENYIIFTVLKDGRFLNSEKYLVYQ